MDIVTAGRALLRRWYLFIPLLVIGILASVHFADATKPTYESTGEFIIINGAVRPVTTTVHPSPTRATVAPARGKASTTPTPTPTATAKPTPEPTTTVVNPYTGQPDLLRAAVLAHFNEGTFPAELSSQGFKGTFQVTTAKKQPILVVTAHARHKDQALALASVVLKDANAQVQAVQTVAGAPTTSLTGAQVIVMPDGANNVTSGKSKRLITGVVVSAAAALALSIALDSTVLSLRRRRLARDGGDPRTSGDDSTGSMAQSNVVAGRHAGSRRVPTPTDSATPASGDVLPFAGDEPEDSAGTNPVGRRFRRGPG